MSLIRIWFVFVFISTAASAFPGDDATTNTELLENVDVRQALEAYGRHSSQIESGVGVGRYRTRVNGELWNDILVQFQFVNDRFRLDLDYQHCPPKSIPVTTRVLLGDASAIFSVTYSPSYQGSPCRVEVCKPNELNFAARGFRFDVRRLGILPVNVVKFLSRASQLRQISDDEFALVADEEFGRHELAVSRSRDFTGTRHTLFDGDRIVQERTALWSDRFGEWFPEKVTFLSTNSQRELHAELVISSLTLNVPLELDALDAAHLPTCENARLVDRRFETNVGHVHEFDLEEAATDGVPLADVVEQLPVVPVIDAEARSQNDSPPNSRWPWIAMGNLVLVVIAGGYFWFRRTSRYD